MTKIDYLPAAASPFTRNEIASYHTKEGFTHYAFYVEIENKNNEGHIPHGVQIFAVAKTATDAKAMVEEHFQNIHVVYTQVTQMPGCDFVRQENPSQTLGFNKAVSIKTILAQQVLEMMDSFDDGESKYQESVSLVALQAGITKKQLHNQLNDFI